MDRVNISTVNQRTPTTLMPQTTSLSQHAPRIDVQRDEGNREKSKWRDVGRWRERKRESEIDQITNMYLERETRYNRRWTVDEGERKKKKDRDRVGCEPDQIPCTCTTVHMKKRI